MTDGPEIDPGPDVYAEGVRQAIYMWIDETPNLTAGYIEDGVQRAVAEWIERDHTVEIVFQVAVTECVTKWLDAHGPALRRAIVEASRTKL